MTESEKLKMVEGSIFTITFIKTDDNKIEVRETEYMPDWEYLKANNFNIADNILSKSNNFTGRVTIKKWDDTIIGMKRMQNGVVVGNYKLLKQKNNTNLSQTQYDPNCIYLVICWYERYCTSGEPEECGPWVLLYCDEPELQYCTNDPSNCDPGDEVCLCEYYGVCTPGDEPPPPPIEPDQPVAASYNFENVFAVKQSGSSGTNEDWYIKQKATINGMKFLNTPADNYYTSYLNINPATYKNNDQPHGGLYGNPISSIYCVVNGGSTFTTSAIIENNKKFTNTSEGVVYYPNYQNQQNQPAPFYNSYTNTKQAIAESDL